MVVGFDFNYRADESAPMAAVGVAKRGFERDRDSGRADVLNPHNLFHGTTIYSRGTRL